jgi:hypothetical protein
MFRDFAEHALGSKDLLIFNVFTHMPMPFLVNSAWGATLLFFREAFPCSSLHNLSLRILLYIILTIAYSNIIVYDLAYECTNVEG